MELIHSEPKWGAEVVYGDTDSLFIYLPGRTRAEAFDIGEDIANSVTKLNPKPVKLKFEKVYHPCVLLAKKRYVGFKYETRSQTEPDFDAKGIETVRRDGTPAEQKIEETILKTLFRTADLSQVKEYFQRQCTKIMSGKVSIQDFCFAKEVKMGTYRYLSIILIQLNFPLVTNLGIGVVKRESSPPVLKSLQKRWKTTIALNHNMVSGYHTS